MTAQLRHLRTGVGRVSRAENGTSAQLGHNPALIVPTGGTSRTGTMIAVAVAALGWLVLAPRDRSRREILANVSHGFGDPMVVDSKRSASGGLAGSVRRLTPGGGDHPPRPPVVAGGPSTGLVNGSNSAAETCSALCRSCSWTDVPEQWPHARPTRVGRNRARSEPLHSGPAAEQQRAGTANQDPA